LCVVPSSLCAYRQSSERRARAHREKMFNLNSGLAQGSALHLAVGGITRSSLYPVLARAGVEVIGVDVLADGEVGMPWTSYGGFLSPPQTQISGP